MGTAREIVGMCLHPQLPRPQLAQRQAGAREKRAVSHLEMHPGPECVCVCPCVLSPARSLSFLMTNPSAQMLPLCVLRAAALHTRGAHTIQEEEKRDKRDAKGAEGRWRAGEEGEEKGRM